MYGAFWVGGTAGGGYEYTPESCGSPLGAAPSSGGRPDDDVSGGGAPCEAVSEFVFVGVIVAPLFVFDEGVDAAAEEAPGVEAVLGVDAVLEGADADGAFAALEPADVGVPGACAELPAGVVSVPGTVKVGRLACA